MSQFEVSTSEITHTYLPIDQFLPYRINVLSSRVSCSLSRIYQNEYGITIPQWRILMWLDNHDELLAKDICALTHMDKTQVSRSIDQLVKLKLITRHKLQQDNRSISLKVTAEGKQLLSKLLPKVMQWEEQLLSVLSRQEERQLFSIIEKLDQQLNVINGNNKCSPEI